MESTINEVNVNYYPDIALAIQDLSSEPISLTAVIDELHDVIVGCYDGEDFSKYKRCWIQTVVEYFKSKQIELSKTRKPNWESSSAAIINRLVLNSYDFQVKAVTGMASVDATPVDASSSLNDCAFRSPASVTRRSSSSTVQSSASDSVDATSIKLVKLTAADKENVKLIPSHSLILDIADSCWDEVFAPNERDEMRDFRSVGMPNLSDEAESYLEKLNGLDEAQLHAQVESDDLAMESDSKWIQKSYRDAFRLLRSDFFPLQNQTEGEVVKRVWSCVDSCFDFSLIKCVSGEKCSRASADARNRGRSVSDVGRQYSGRKMDYLSMTKKEEYEDMANSIISTHSGLSHDMTVVGYYIGEIAIQLLTIDFPAGYVAHLDGFGPISFPKEEKKICSALPRVLRLIMAGKLMMEEVKEKVDNYKGTEPIVRRGMIYDHILPTFIPIVAQIKKRKINL